MGGGIMFRFTVTVCVLLVVALLGCWHLYDARAELQREVSMLERRIEAQGRLQAAADESERQAINKLAGVQDASDKRAQELQERLRTNDAALRACRVSGDTLRVLNRPGVPGVAADAPSNRPAADAVEAGAGTTCLAVVETFDENHRRFDAAVVQLNECRAFYARTRETYCKIIGGC